MFDRERVKMIKEMYPPGTRIMLDDMPGDPCPIESGTCGTVKLIDDIGTLHCDFDNGRQLGVIWGVDQFHVIEQEEAPSDDESMEMT